MMTSAISQQHSYRREANRSAVEDLSRSPEYFL